MKCTYLNELKIRSMSKRVWWFSSLVLASGLLAYGFQRYNGYDLSSYFQLIKSYQGGNGFSGEKPLSL